MPKPSSSFCLRVAFCLLPLIQIAASGVVLNGRASNYSERWSWDETQRGPDGMKTGRPLNIGHRGASGMYPEHTEIAYEKAAEQKADYVECDVTVTKDLQLICSHEPWISVVSNVVNNSLGGPPHDDFSSRRRTYNMDDDDETYDWIDKGNITDYFTYDFTLNELLTLRRFQARDYRDTKYNWLYTFVTFKEYLMMAKEFGFGIYPEIKHGWATNKILQDHGHENVTIEGLLLKDLGEAGYNSSSDPCLIQAFELTSLKWIRANGSDLRLIFLFDKIARTTDEDLDMYADIGLYGLGPDKDLIVIKNADNHINRTNADFIERAHSRNLKIHAFTFRNEHYHLRWEYGQDPYVEYQLYLDLGIDGYFTDFPGSLDRFFQEKRTERELAMTSGACAGRVGSTVLRQPVVVLCVLLGLLPLLKN